jgi:hypothetical protein
MDRRQLVGLLLVLLLPGTVTKPTRAASVEAKKSQWVILAEDDGAFGGVLLGPAVKRSTKKPIKVKSASVEGSGKIKLASTHITGTYKGSLLTAVSARKHSVSAAPVIDFKKLSTVGKACALAVDETLDIIDALKQPNRDALNQIGVARNKITALESAAAASTTLSEEDKAEIQEDIQETRQDLNELQGTIGSLNNPSNEQLQAVYLQILDAAAPLQDACTLVLPIP